ncbi:hypothetical protein PMAYCL1PPCAC_25546, partial [Pristionchus mayeri]
ADNSKFVLLWDINNATAVHAAGKAESGVFNEGGFNWTVTFVKREGTSNFADITLQCDVDHKGPWKCEADVTIGGRHRVGGDWKSDTKRISFHTNNKLNKLNWFTWNKLISLVIFYIVQDKVTVEFHIHIISSEPTVEPGMFATPNKMSKVVLKIGDKKLHVFKELLALHSPVFETMFFGDFAEKGKEEVEIKDAIYQEFIELLNVIYCETNGISDFTVSNILKLADRFQ